MAIIKRDINYYWMKSMEFGDKLGCHQIPDRCFYIKGYQFPVCARCTGVIFGELLFFLFFLLKIRISLMVSILLLIPMGVDWGLQYLKIAVSNNVRRFITGLLGGLALTNIYCVVFGIIYNAICCLG